ncbi:response regulator, partial [Klebsiella pneumoniae]|nr:response regulator [Klebsiella pneumoniae]
MRNIFALTSALEHKGAIVEIGRNGREAIERLEQHDDIDLVLMDVMMPEMDGFEATRLIRQQPRWRKLPIIAVTAKAMKD